MLRSKWPKILPDLTPDQKKISDDFMKYWHEVIATDTRYNLIEKFNHGYPIKHSPKDFVTSLEIGAGLGEHFRQQSLTEEQKRNYVALEIRPAMAEKIKTAFPEVQTLVGDCQQPLPFADNHFDRIIAIHVLEHLPNLPATIKEMHRLCNKTKGRFTIVIPCEGSFAYNLARRFSAQRIFEKMYKQSYDWLIKREHINMPDEIFEELEPYFIIEQRSFFPIPLPLFFSNLCIGGDIKTEISRLKMETL